MTLPGQAPATIITGASSGIGRELARLAAVDRQPLVLIGRNEVELAKLAQELETTGASALPLALDLRRPDAISAIEGLLTKHGLYCDILINSAGFGVFGAVAEADADAQVSLVDVNVRVPLALSRKFLPGMIARRRGGIINIGSITGYSPGPYMAAYCASKAFIRSWSAALSAEVAHSGVTVTCLTPGVVRTAFFERPGMGNSRLIKLLPRGSAVHAAKAGWKAFKAGKPFVMPRFMDRFVVGVCWILPDRVLVWFVRALQRPA